ncbi:MAG: pyridoxal phosphate-dependent aminotransferase, partial [Bacillota bacterium]|nr:pyridoxal phosphate-dependent aminotransferase [Bacillota bacterium]
MIAQQYKQMLKGKSVIRELAEFAAERGKEIGYENIFDFSLGNPSVPVPKEFTMVMMELLSDKSSTELHGYS